MNRKLASLACALAALALVAAPAAAAPTKVTIKGSFGAYKFSPKTATIKKGKTVSWSWDSDSEHNVKFGKKLDGKHSKTATKVSGFKVTFTKAGTYNYRCTVHGFTGKVVVNAG
jgi:plastocyanin